MGCCAVYWPEGSLLFNHWVWCVSAEAPLVIMVIILGTNLLTWGQPQLSLLLELKSKLFPPEKKKQMVLLQAFKYDDLCGWLHVLLTTTDTGKKKRICLGCAIDSSVTDNNMFQTPLFKGAVAKHKIYGDQTKQKDTRAKKIKIFHLKSALKH